MPKIAVKKEQAMKKRQTLMEKQDEARQEILALGQRTSTAIIFNFFIKWFPKSITEQNPFYWLFQIFSLGAVIFVPGLLISMVFNEMAIWPPDVSAWFWAVVLAIYAFVLAHVLFRMTFHEIANHIVYKMTNPRHLTSLVEFCESSVSPSRVFLISGAVIWPILALVLLRFPGIGLNLMTIPTGGLIGGSIQAVFWSIGSTNQLKGFQYDLNAFTPINSEVVVRLSGVLSNIIYLNGAFFAVLTLFAVSEFFGEKINTLFGIPITLLGLILILIQFLLNRSTINGIVEKERWASLNKIQVQMNSIQATANLSQGEASERLLRLADLHEKIRSNRAGNFDAKSLINLLTQLMLPLLGLLLGNIDKLADFLK